MRSTTRTQREEALRLRFSYYADDLTNFVRTMRRWTTNSTRSMRSRCGASINQDGRTNPC